MTRALLLVIAAVVLASACSSADDSGPPEIVYGRDICVECGMIITEARFAAAYRLEDGTEKSFDDLGGLIKHMRTSGDNVDSTNAWVHDFETAEWVNAGDAYYVATASVATPMGHSILAFSDEDRATVFAQDVDANVVRWESVIAMPDVDGLIGDHHTTGDNG